MGTIIKYYIYMLFGNHKGLSTSKTNTATSYVFLSLNPLLFTILPSSKVHGKCIPLPIWKFLASPNRKSMGQTGTLMIFGIQTMKSMKLKTERDLSYIDSLTVEFF